MAQAAILPLGETQFFDDNGDPLSGGSVAFYIPSTTTFKTTWQDALQSVPNANPVVLDAAGRAIIYGSGQYRQVVKDVDGNTIWDQLTAGAPVFNSSGTSISSNTTTDLGSTNSNNVTITGSTTINNFGASASLESPIYFVTFAASLRIVNSASIICLGGQDIKTRAGAFAIMQYLGSSVWQIMAFQYPDGTTISWSGTETAVPSAATVDLGAQLTNFVQVTGSTGPITSFGSSASLANPIYVVLFASTPTVQNGANIVIPGGSDLVMAAGDAVFVFYKGSGVWQVLGRVSTSGGGGGGSAAPCIIADTRNSLVKFASNTTLTMTVDEVIAKTSIAGTAYLGNSLSSTLNFGSTGANGLDTGAIAASTFYGIYWIYNPGSNTWASLASLSFTAPTLPSGYTAFALVAVVPTNASSQITAGYLARQRACVFQPIAINTSLAQEASLTSISVALGVPSVAQACSGLLLTTAASVNATVELASDSSGTGPRVMYGMGASGTGGTPAGSFGKDFLDLFMLTAQTIYYLANATGTCKLYITGFSI